MALLENQRKLVVVGALAQLTDEAGLSLRRTHRTRVTINPADNSYGASELTDAARRC